MIKELQENYGLLFEKELLEEIVAIGTFKEVPEGYKLMEIGDYIKSMPLLISLAQLKFFVKIKMAMSYYYIT